MMASKTEVNEAFLKVIFSTVVKATLYEYSVPEEFLEVDTVAYNERGKNKVAVFVAYLQDHDKAVKELDEKVLSALISEVKARKLLGAVDDISVNLWQWKDGKIVFSPLWEEE